jgi:outer membrane receptor for ferrienterochelin and colicin
MYLKIYFTLILLVISMAGYGQHTISGRVTSTSGEVLIGAAVQVVGTTNGTITDVNGGFELSNVPHGGSVVISFVGYINDTISVDEQQKFEIVLAEASEQLQTVTIRAGASSIDELQPILNELISEKELVKAACCNLSESFETNASVDVSMTDAVSGAKMIRMLGLDGRYVLISREGIPHIRGLNSRYGLTYVPGTWIQSIDVGKGAGSVLNGYESMSGQINMEFKKPEESEAWYFNAYLNSFGRMEANVNNATNLSDKWSVGILAHANYLVSEIDGNDDGFMDLPKSRQFNILNRYKYHGEWSVSQIGIQYMIDENAGGQRGFDFSDDLLTSSSYGFKNNARRFEVFGKTGLLFPEKPYKGWGFQYSLAYQEFDGGAGRRIYEADEKTGTFNAIYQNIIGDTRHQFKTGVSYLIDGFDETYYSELSDDLDTAIRRTESVPGIYYEYNYLPNEDFTLVAGYRLDFHNLYGLYNAPRLHVRWATNKHMTFRVSAGKGYRTANMLMENSQFFASNRRIILAESPNPESSWNFGSSVASHLHLFEKPLTLVLDYFYTDFLNQLVYDQDQGSDKLVIYNLQGRSFAHSLQIEAQYELVKRLKMKAAYKYYDVQQTTNGRLQPVTFTPRDRYFLNLGYATDFEKWQIDFTWSLNGPNRLPNTPIESGDAQVDSFSLWYSMVSGQISKGFLWGNIYVGGENLLNFKQPNPIMHPEDPFGDSFDASMVWGPVAGRMIYTGIRYKIR